MDKQTAWTSCERLNKTLATITDRYTERRLAKILAQSDSDGAWIGLNMELIPGREWKWLHGI